MAIPKEEGDGVGPKGEGALSAPLGEPEVWIGPAHTHIHTHAQTHTHTTQTHAHRKGLSDLNVDKFSTSCTDIQTFILHTSHTHRHTDTHTHKLGRRGQWSLAGGLRQMDRARLTACIFYC